MSIYSKRPKLLHDVPVQTKLFKNDQDYMSALIKSGEFASRPDAVRLLVNEAVRIRIQKDAGKDETNFAIVKKHQMVVSEGTKPLVAKLDEVDKNMRVALAQSAATTVNLENVINKLNAEMQLVKAEVQNQQRGINRLLEISVICYGILRHYVLGIFVTKLTKVKFSDYVAGFSDRVGKMRLNLRAGNVLLEGDYEALADEFARRLNRGHDH